MRSLSLIALSLALLAAALLGAGPASGGPPTAPPQSFAFAIGHGHLAGGPAQVAERLGAFDLVIVDGEEARADELEALRERGATVLGYLSVGTIEQWHAWYPRLKRYRLSAWQDWKNEWFADVSRRGLRRELARKIAPTILDKGFDGIFLDNVDMIETRGHRKQREGMRKLVLALGRLTHSDGRLLFAQNGLWGLRKLDLVKVLDGWNREDVTWTYDFDHRRYERNREGQTRAALRELEQMAALGKTVTATDYTRAGDAAAREESIANACASGALPYVTDIELSARRLPDPPLTCP